jgi:demethylmenaquinone methyltransferase/2-methoxy-6-polyprenyl-1,4-benzoquinol methylase
MKNITAREPGTIVSMFSQIAPSYDLANSVLSFGIHHLWKRKLVARSGARADSRVLDCATGTGDLAFRFEGHLDWKSRVVGTDFCEPMLEVARAKATKLGSRVEFRQADVTALPFATGEFDVASISFGIRNAQDPLRALEEMGRVVRPGGNVMVLEFGQPRFKPWGSLFQFYSKKVLPRVGGWVSGHPEAYRYLERSSGAFPCGEDFIALAAQSGRFARMNFEPLQGGIAYLYKLTVAERS